MNMNTEHASKLFESLASPTRLAIFQALTAEGGHGMVAGDLAKQLNLAPNNLSFHLKTLANANLVYSEQQGKFVRYFANLAMMNGLIEFLLHRCCENASGGDCEKFCQSC